MAGKAVLIGEKRVAYDRLVIATGARHAYFNHEEWERFAPGLKKIDDATDIRCRILLALERADNSSDERERKRLLSFVIVGGGPTGVEMAGAIAELARKALSIDFRNMDPRSARVVLVESGPRVLANFPEPLSAVAKRALEKMGVEVRLGSRVSRCDPEGVIISDERIEADTIIWAAGVMASPAAKWLGAEMDHASRVVVGPELSLDSHPDIFVIGDTALAKAADGKPLPGAGRQARGRLCGASNCRTGARQAGAGALPLSPSRHHGDDRAQIGGRRFRQFSPQRLYRVAPLGPCSRLLSGRFPQPGRRDDGLAMGLCDLQPRCAADHRPRQLTTGLEACRRRVAELAGLAQNRVDLPQGEGFGSVALGRNLPQPYKFKYGYDKHAAWRGLWVLVR